MPERRLIFCCHCVVEAQARLTDGRECYPHRPDLAELPFWKHDTCGNWVGCHHKTRNRTRPLGCIPGPAMKKARGHIHEVLDPLWKSGRISRRDLYGRLTARLGRDYHTAELRTLEEARMIYREVQRIAADAPELERIGRQEA